MVLKPLCSVHKLWRLKHPYGCPVAQCCGQSHMHLLVLTSWLHWRTAKLGDPFKLWLCSVHDTNKLCSYNICFHMHLWRSLTSGKAAFCAHGMKIIQTGLLLTHLTVVASERKTRMCCQSQRSFHCFPADCFPISDPVSMTYLIPIGTPCDLLVSSYKDLTRVNKRWRLLDARLLTMIER